MLRPTTYLPIEQTSKALSVVDQGVDAAVEGEAFAVSAALAITNAKIGAISIAVPAAVAATLTTDMTNATSDLTLTARRAGSAGNSLSIEYIDPEDTDQPLTVSMDESTGIITVTLATGEAGAITSTAALVKAAINNDPVVSKWVACEDEGAGTGIVNAVAVASLAGGTDARTLQLDPVELSSSGATMVCTLREAASYTGGDAYVPKNKQRTSGPASQVAVKTLADATIAEGTGYVILEQLTFAAAGKDTLGNKYPWILKPGLNYVIAAANGGASPATVNFRASWKELA